MRDRWFRVWVAVMGTVAGAVALAGVLHGSGVRAGWLERFHLHWAISSEGLAERAYERLLSGDQGRALELFELAVQRDPASPYRWCDWGEARLAAGDEAGARECMARGLERGPYIGPILARAVNFAYRTREQDEALEYGKRLLAITGAYDEAIFAVWRGLECGIGRAVRQGIPDARAAGAYLRHLMRRGAVEEAGAAWGRMAERGWADDGLADEYAGFLLRAGHVGEAVRAWAAHMAKREPGYPEENAVFNGSFEREPAGRVLDWRIDAVAGARVERDADAATEGRWSLRVSFDGTKNLAYGHVSQRAAVRPGWWVLEAWVRVEGITTDEGVGLRVIDVAAPRRLDARTETVTGTHGWRALRARFAVGSGTSAVQVAVVRNPSLKFDNRLGGTVWIDAVSLRPSSQVH